MLGMGLGIGGFEEFVFLGLVLLLFFDFYLKRGGIFLNNGKIRVYNDVGRLVGVWVEYREIEII